MFSDLNNFGICDILYKVSLFLNIQEYFYRKAKPGGKCLKKNDTLVSQILTESYHTKAI
jgi:hypothetical protein